MYLARIAAVALLLCTIQPAPAAEHVVLIVWDGMRPDFVTAENSPTLHALAEKGVFFRNNHAVYPSSTNVNGAVFAPAITRRITGSSRTRNTARRSIR